jgi:hypothetical protein
MVDCMCRKSTQDIAVAEFVYDEIKKGAKTTEILKSETI